MGFMVVVRPCTAGAGVHGAMGAGQGQRGLWRGAAAAAAWGAYVRGGVVIASDWNAGGLRGDRQVS